jgi:hypothetical protein
MPATRRPARLACIATLLAIAALAPFARAQSERKPEPFATVGPQQPLTPAQASAIAAKRAADPGTHLSPSAPVAGAKLAGAPPSAPASAPVGVSAGATVSPAKLLQATSPVSGGAKPGSWRSATSRLGAIPRPEWPAAWTPAKPADVTISRPLPGKDVSSPARPAESPGGAH